MIYLFILRSWFQRQQTCPTCRLNILRTTITAPQPAPQQTNNNANPRPNEPAAAQPNPFFNLLNQTMQPNATPSTSATTSPAPQAFPAAMPPPFFFPTMPFMAPYTIPPPPMPQNLDQLTDEELRALEGNERKHVEERLKLLRNVQTMLNASAALMNQYQMVVSNLPPVPIQTQPVASTSTAPEEHTEQKEEKPSSTTSEDVKTDVKLEDVGSEDSHMEHENSSSHASQPSTSKLTTLDSPSSSTTFIATEASSTNGESEEAMEIRKRRLQKFLQSD